MGAFGTLALPRPDLALTRAEAAEAACLPHGMPDLWLAPADDREVAAAKAVCEACPVRARCAEDGIANATELSARLQTGIWGGMTEGERRKQLKQQQRGRFDAAA